VQAEFMDKSIPGTRPTPQAYRNGYIDLSQPDQEKAAGYEAPQHRYDPPGMSSGQQLSGSADKDMEQAKRQAERDAKRQAAADLFREFRARAQGKQRDRGDDGRER
jgi:hypothetical protein